jgi:hypothetical protein
MTAHLQVLGGPQGSGAIPSVYPFPSMRSGALKEFHDRSLVIYTCVNRHMKVVCGIAWDNGNVSWRLCKHRNE